MVFTLIQHDLNEFEKKNGFFVKLILIRYLKRKIIMIY